ncbi:MAG: hypothetical protein ACLFTE_07245 [Salinivenus sp.]
MPTRAVCLWVVLLLFVPGRNALAQQPAETARARALCDFHGPDSTGKDGPRAKAGFDLLLLYHRARLLPDSAALAPQSSTLQLRDGSVAIDAIAASDPAVLRQDLDSLGLQDIGQAGRVVSGWFPIDRIPDLARLSSLRGVQPARARTHDDQHLPSPSLQPAPDSSSGTPRPG